MRTASFLNLKKRYKTWRFESSVNKDQTNLQMVFTFVKTNILKQWKKSKTVYKNLMKLNVAFGCNMTDEAIYKVANSRLGLYRRCGMNVVNYLLSQKVLSMPNKKENRPGLIDPLAYYLRNT